MYSNWKESYWVENNVMFYDKISVAHGVWASPYDSSCSEPDSRVSKDKVIVKNKKHV